MRVLALSLLLAVSGFAAPPDCQYSFRLSNRVTDTPDGINIIALAAGAAAIPAINNKGQGCVGWEMMTSVEGLSAISIQLEDSANTYTIAGGSPTQWIAFQGTAVSGSNPSTATTVSTYVATGYYPWIRVNVASSTGSGSVDVLLFGWKSTTLLTGGGVGTVTGGPFTNRALVLGAGLQALQNSNCTQDVGLNILTCPGGFVSSSANGGYFQLGAGTHVAPIPAGSFTWGAPTSITTPYELQPTASPPAANQFMLFPAPTSSVSQAAWKTFDGHNIAGGLNCSAASASGTAYTCTTSPSFTPADGDAILFEADVANTGAATLNVNSSSAAPLRKQGGGTALVANDILAGQDTLLIYDGTNWQMQGQSGNAAGAVTTTGSPASGQLSKFSGASSITTATATDVAGSLYVAGGGTAQAQTATLSPAIAALTIGLEVRWLPVAANTAAGPTLAVNGLTATTITKLGATPLGPNDLTTTAIAIALYDGTRFQLLNPQGSSSQVNITAITATNPSAEATLEEVSLSAGFLNTLKQPFIIHGSGIFTVAAAQTPTLRVRAKLCTVSGCGSGTVVVISDITSTATVAATNNQWNLNLLLVTSATGATGTVLVHGNLVIDLAGGPTSADSTFADTNTASSAAIDLTAALFVDFTVLASSSNAGNTFTQQIAAVMPQSNPAGAATSSNFVDVQGPTSTTAGTAVDQTMYTTTVGSGVPGAGKCLVIEFSATYVSGSGSATFKLQLGVTQFSLYAFSSLANISAHIVLCNNAGVQNAQFGFLDGLISSGALSGSIYSSAIDLSIAQNLLLVVNAPATMSWKGNGWVVSKIN